MRSRLLVAASLLAASACTLLDARDPLPERDEVRCQDGEDNDVDGRVDCADPDCDASCRERECADGLDDDRDGRIDCRDADCADEPRCLERDATACGNGADDDADGLIDCADPECAALAEACNEDEPAQCANGIDDDRDGRVDCEDDGCAGRCPESSAPACADGWDQDGDGRVDADDARCWPSSQPVLERCASIAATSVDADLGSLEAVRRQFYVAGEEPTITRYPGVGEALTLADTTLGTLETYAGRLGGVSLQATVRVEDGEGPAVALAPADGASVGAPLDTVVTSVELRLRGGQAILQVGEEAAELDLGGAVGWYDVRLVGSTDGDVACVTAHLAPVPLLGEGPATDEGIAACDEAATTESRVLVAGAGGLSRLELAIDEVLRGGRCEGLPSPQITSTAPRSPLGDTVGLASSPEGYCALVRDSEVLTYGSTQDPDEPDESAGNRWALRSRGFGAAIAPAESVVALALAWDEVASRYFAAALTDAGSFVRVSAEACGDWRTAPAAGLPARPLATAAPASLSYVIRSRPSGERLHELYWVEELEGDPWLVVARSPNGAAPEAGFRAPVAIARLDPNRVIGPVSVSALASDLVMLHHSPGLLGSEGVRLRLQDTSGAFVEVGGLLLTPSRIPGTFDRDRVAAAALSARGSDLLVLYGGVGDFLPGTSGRARGVGTAWLAWEPAVTGP